MKKVFFLIGFNNWGKSFTIQNIFSYKSFCGKRQSYTIPDENIRIYVQHQSNDDISLVQILKNIYKAIQNKYDNILIAFCPTKEPKNQSIEIIHLLKKHNYKIYFIFLLYKWDGHAKLLVDNILKHFSNLVDEHKVIDTEINQSDEHGKLRAEEVKKYIKGKLFE